MPSYPDRRAKFAGSPKAMEANLHRFRSLCVATALALSLTGCFVSIRSDSADRQGSDRTNEGGSGRGGRGGAGGRGGRAGQPGEPGQPGQPGGQGVVVQGSGTVQTEDRPVGDFDSVHFRGSAQLLIDQTGTEALSVEAEDNILPHLTSEVSGRRLTLGVKPNVSLQITRPIIFRLSVKELKEIGASGSGNIDAKNLSTDTLQIDQSGSFDMTLQGRAPRQAIDLSGSGSLNAGNLDGSEVTVDLSGSGDIVVVVSSRLNVRISGSGNVQYVGDPRVNQSISGSGSVRKK